MRRILCQVLVVALALHAVPLSVMGQGTAAVSGVAQTPGGQPLSNVTVQIRSLATAAVVGKATTDQQGGFSLTGIQPGEYVVEILDANGNVTGTSQVLVLIAGQTTSVVVVPADDESDKALVAALLAAAGAAAIVLFIVKKDDPSPSK